MWDESKCDRCGDCLVRCQYVNYSREKAIQEIVALTEGRDAEILRECITCGGCNEYCKKGADPWDLIVDLQYESNSMLPLVPKQRIEDIMKNWSLLPSRVTSGDPDKPVLDLSVVGPFYNPKGQIFDDLGTVRGGNYYPYTAMMKRGLGHPTKEMAERFVGNLGKVGAKEVVFLHSDDYAMVIIAQHYGIEMPFRPVYIFEYLYNYLRDHMDNVTKLGRKVAVMRNCMSRYMPDQEVYLDAIFGLIGVERVARKYDRENALCCGLGPIWWSPEKLAELVEMNLSDAEEYGAEAMIMVCWGCWRTIAEPSKERGMPPIFVHDLCRVALGELPFPCEDRCRDICSRL